MSEKPPQLDWCDMVELDACEECDLTASKYFLGTPASFQIWTAEGWNVTQAEAHGMIEEDGANEGIKSCTWVDEQGICQATYVMLLPHITSESLLQAHLLNFCYMHEAVVYHYEDTCITVAFLEGAVRISVLPWGEGHLIHFQLLDNMGCLEGVMMRAAEYAQYAQCSYW